MTHIYRILLLSFFCCSFWSCVEEDQLADNPMGNFDALWKIIDEKYCFLDEKQLDWDEIGRKHRQYISPTMSDDALFEVLGNMLAELKDGHVNMSAAHDVARYWGWYEDYPHNFDENILYDYYLKRNYKIAAGLKYRILEDNIGYIFYESFVAGIGDGNLDQVLEELAICDGLILDVRNNGGGVLTTAHQLAARFTNQKVLTGYMTHKTGKGHSDFSAPLPQYVEPSTGIRWQKKAVVLSNRRSFSATNEFLAIVKQFDNVTIIGTKSGGGGGLPFSSELPNGWSIRFSASPRFDANLQSIENGIDPDIEAEIGNSPLSDGVIECARAFFCK